MGNWVVGKDDYFIALPDSLMEEQGQNEVTPEIARTAGSDAQIYYSDMRPAPQTLNLKGVLYGESEAELSRKLELLRTQIDGCHIVGRREDDHSGWVMTLDTSVRSSWMSYTIGTSGKVASVSFGFAILNYSKVRAVMPKLRNVFAWTPVTKTLIIPEGSRILKISASSAVSITVSTQKNVSGTYSVYEVPNDVNLDVPHGVITVTSDVPALVSFDYESKDMTMLEFIALMSNRSVSKMESSSNKRIMLTKLFMPISEGQTTLSTIVIPEGYRAVSVRTKSAMRLRWYTDSATRDTDVHREYDDVPKPAQLRLDMMLDNEERELLSPITGGTTTYYIRNDAQHAEVSADKIEVLCELL